MAENDATPAPVPHKPETRDISDALRSTRLREGYINGEFDDMVGEEIANVIGISRSTLYLWKNRLDWENILAERRKRYAGDMLEIDRSMIRQAKKGQVAAAILAYQRFDGWVPTTQTITTEKDDAALRAEADKIMAEHESAKKQNDQRPEDAPGPNLPGAGQAAPA